ncbi:ATP-binding cassette domain-containing protein [Gemmobacter sp. 24YEA27]|uniref:ATP-binding cassette domain-containing protein n=1 Tax=Gemmobacter sp. 24YEA27 TaxID=3040672 RepID=UPI0024B3557A|nr:ATP-binding cassette domain-containing protein [Gemmobacter sp. 24YEA27]
MSEAALPLLLERVVVHHGAQDRRMVLDHVDLTVAPGERLCILGESGSGKTTLLEVISGFRRPDAGRVRLFDIDPAGAADRVRARLRRQQLGFIFQDYALIEGLTALANIDMPLRLDGVRAEALISVRRNGWQPLASRILLRCPPARFRGAKSNAWPLPAPQSMRPA